MKTTTAHLFLALAVLALATYIGCAYDPGPLQDFCVAIDDPKDIRTYISINYLTIYLIA